MKDIDPKLKELISDSKPDSFDPFFATRVMQKVKTEASQENILAEALSSLFRKVAIASVALVIAVTAYNITSHWEYRQERNLIELAFNLTPVTLDTAIESNMEIL